MTGSKGRPLLDWLMRPSSDHGIHFACADGSWDHWSYDRLATLARRLAAGLSGIVGADDVVGILGSAGPKFVGSFFGTLLAGGVPCVLAPPSRLKSSSVYAQHLQGLLRTARPLVILAESGRSRASLSFLFASDGPEVIDAGRLIGDSEVWPGGRPPDGLALLQFTSGSSGSCRAVRIPFDAVESNLAAITDWLRWSREDVAASWLPLHHDMGLVACLLGPIVTQTDLWLLTPELFVRDPLRYLRCFADRGATLSAMPNFGLDYVVERVSPKSLDGMDFSGWRALVVGAEPVRAVSLRSFFERFAPFGLSPRSLLPAYGLAEATLAVTGVRWGRTWTQVGVEPSSVTMSGSIRDAPAEAEEASVVVGCGGALAGVAISVETEAGERLAEGRVGEIVVSGRSVADGYAGEPPGGPTRFRKGALRTGDAGFVLDGQLFVLGRLGDSVKVLGRALFAEDIEAALEPVGLRARGMATLLGYHEGQPTVVVLLERPTHAQLEEVESIVQRRAAGAAAVVHSVPRGTIPRTSSGKTRRRELWRCFCEGRLVDVME